MKILFVNPRFHTNQVHSIKILLENNHQVTMYVANKGYTESYSLLQPIIIQESFISSWMYSFFQSKKPNRKYYFPKPLVYWRKLQKSTPDVVIIRLYNPIFSYMTAIFCRMLGVKIVFYEQIDARSLEKMFNDDLRGLLRRLRFNFRLSVFNAAWMTTLPSAPGMAGRLPPRCYFVPFAVPYREHAKDVPNVIRFLMIGKFEERKNHLLLLRAVEAISKKKSHNFHITLIGEAANTYRLNYKQYIKDVITTKQLEGYVTILPTLPHDKIGSVYESHDVFVLPAREEPASVSILEAMAYGLPVICSDTCGTKTYVDAGKNGFIFTSDDVNSLVEKIELFLENPSVVHIMSNNAITSAKNHFSGKVFYQAFMHMVSSC